MLCPMKMCNPMPISHDCNQEECAWWNEYFSQCSIAINLRDIKVAMRATILEEGKCGKNDLARSR